MPQDLIHLRPLLWFLAAPLAGCPLILPAEHDLRVDADGDGYEVAGYSDGEDCDDTNAAVHPDVTEVCGDGQDNDCDGTANTCGLSGTVDLSDANTKITPAARSDKLGTAVANVGDVDGDGTEDLLVGAPGVQYSFENTGAGYLMLGPAPGGKSLGVSNADLLIYGANESEGVGETVAAGGDMNGDGYGDLLLGAPNRSKDDNEKIGAYYVVYGPGGPAMTTSAADATGLGGAAYDKLGSALAAGNFTGNNQRDLAVGGPYANKDGSDAGIVYLYTGPVEGGRNASKADYQIYGGDSDYVGFALLSGDFTGDGLDDLWIGAPGSDDEAAEAGAAFLFAGPVEVNGLASAGYDGRLVGLLASDAGGSSFASGDVNGDGYLDAIIGCPGADGVAADAGSALILYGPISGERPADAGAMGQTGGDLASTSVAAGDADGDGIDDLLVGAPARDVNATDNGAAYLLYGPVDAKIALGKANVKIGGEVDEDYLGAAVAMADWDKNGSSDMILGAYGQDQDGAFNNGGLVYVFLIEGL